MFRKKLLLPLFFGTLVLVFFLPIIFGRVLYCCDNLLINLPARAVLFTELSLGRFPFWNPYIFSGTPYAADINISPFYPGLLVEFLFQHVVTAFQLLSLSVIVHIGIGFWGMYWCTKQLSYRRLASLTSATIFAFSGTVLTYVNNIPMLQVAVFTPWVLGLLIRYCQTPTRRLFVTMSFVSALQLIAGHPQLTFYSWLFYIGYILFFSAGTLKDRIKTIVLFAFSVAAISSIQLLPFVEFVIQSTRISSSFAYATQGSLPLTAIIRFLFPAITGDVRVGTDWWQGGSVYGYIGIIPLILAYIASKKLPVMKFFTIVGILSLIAAFGSFTPFFTILYWTIPGISLFRVPAHFLLLYTICMSILAGSGLSTISSSRLPRRYSVGLGMLVVIVIVAFFLSHPIALWIKNMGDSIPQLHSKISYLHLNGIDHIWRVVMLNVLVVSCIFFAYSLVQKEKKKYVVLVGIILELFFYARMSLVTIDHAKLTAYEKSTDASIATLPSSHLSKLFIHPSVFASPIEKHFGEPSIPVETQWQFSILRPNIAVPFHHSYADGYASLIYKPYQQQFYSSITDPTGITISSKDIARLRQLHVESVVLPTGERCTEDCEAFNSYPIIYENRDVIIRRISDASSYATVISDTSEIPVTIATHIPGYISLNVSAPGPSQVRLAETSYPGWTVIVNGKTQPLLPEAYLSTSVPAGTSHVEFIFTPQSVRIGIIITVVASLLGIIIAYTQPSVMSPVKNKASRSSSAKKRQKRKRV